MLLQQPLLAITQFLPTQLNPENCLTQKIWLDSLVDESKKYLDQRGKSDKMPNQQNKTITTKP